MSGDPGRPDDATADLLREVTDLAIAWRRSLPDRRVGRDPAVSSDDLRRALGGPLPTAGAPASSVIRDLAEGAAPGLVAIPGPRYFGFVAGGEVPSALAADWLTSAWDQNAVLLLATPTAAVVEDIAGDWMKALLGLPASASFGFTSGATMSNLTGIVAARDAVLRRVGWDVEERGLVAAPPIRVVVGQDVHASMIKALRLAGLGSASSDRVPADDGGAMRADALADALADRTEPTIVCAQAGEVNTGAFDPIGEIVEIVRTHPNAWLHVDGAFGLWAAATPRFRHLLRGHEGADSWATDCHKWLNVPYDSGFVAVGDAASHRAATGAAAAYLPPAPGEGRDPFDWVPEMSRRARAFPVYAAIRELGSDGIAAMVERCCDLATRLAERLDTDPRIRLLNEVELNQVLVGVGDAATTRAVAARVQDDGTAWLAGTTFHGQPALRISISNWSTREADIDASADAIVRAVDAVTAGSSGSAG